LLIRQWRVAPINVKFLFALRFSVQHRDLSENVCSFSKPFARCGTAVRRGGLLNVCSTCKKSVKTGVLFEPAPLRAFRIKNRK
jgi:hypothetical protein